MNSISFSSKIYFAPEDTYTEVELDGFEKDKIIQKK